MTRGESNKKKRVETEESDNNLLNYDTIVYTMVLHN